jgi:hypothetical protein
MFGMNLVFIGDRAEVRQIMQAMCTTIPDWLNPDMLDLNGDCGHLSKTYRVHELPPILTPKDVDDRFAFLREVNEQRLMLCFFSAQDSARSIPVKNTYIRHTQFRDKSLAWFRENGEQLWAEAKFAWENPEEYAAIRAQTQAAPARRADRRKKP